MVRKVPGLWPIVVIAVTGGVLFFMWRSPHRDDLEKFGSTAAAIVAVSLTVIINARSPGIKRTGSKDGEGALDALADLLAGAIKDQWTRAAGERGLLEPEPIPVRWRRPSLALAGPVSAAVDSTRFPPLPGLPAVASQRLRAGQISDLHAVYGGLGSGRLLIAGAPGSGKSGAAVLLVLAAIKHREQVPDEVRPQVPVPVIFTMDGWDPNEQRVQDWLAVRLQETYPLFAGKGDAKEAAGLLAAGKVAVILDGLDELAEKLRPVALRALSQQATFRVVLLTRSAEMAAAATQGLLEGAAAVELQDIGPGTAARYLTRVQRQPPPRGWRTLTVRLRQTPHSPLANALNSPLTLTLVRDTYRSADNVRELLDFCDTGDHRVSRDEIVDHLLDRVLPVAYVQRPGDPPPRFDLQAAQNAMCYIAARMNQDGTRDLQWWLLRGAAPKSLAGMFVGITVGIAGALALPWPGWGIGIISAMLVGLLVRRKIHFGKPGVARGLAGGILGSQIAAVIAISFLGIGVGNTRLGAFVSSGVSVGVAVAPMSSFYAGLLGGFVGQTVIAFYERATVFQSIRIPIGSAEAYLLNGIGLGLAAGLAAGLFNRRTPAHGLHWSRLGFAIGVSGGFLFGFVIWATAGQTIGLACGAVAIIGGGLAGGLYGAVAPMDLTKATTPRAVLARDRATFLVSLTIAIPVAMAIALGTALSPPSPFNGPYHGFSYGVGIGIADLIAIGFGLAFFQASWGGFVLVCCWLAVSRHLPFRLMRFLEDASEHNVLRTVGAVYQFRHARLQDRLAEQASATSQNLEPTPVGVSEGQSQ